MKIYSSRNVLLFFLKHCFFLSIFCLSANSYGQTLDVKIDEDVSLNFNSYVNFQVSLTENGITKTTYSSRRKTMLKWSELNIKTEGATYLKNGLFKIHSAKELNEKGCITIHVSYKNITNTKHINLTFDEIQIVDFNAKSAKKRRPGNFIGYFFRSIFNKMITDATGVEIETLPRQKRGLNGRKGEHVGMITVDLDTLHINKSIILKATCINKTNSKQAIAYINPEVSQIKIMAEGGHGGNGTYGTDRDGGNGGNAGAGGQVEVYTNAATTPYIKSLIISTVGGFGGFVGNSSLRKNKGINGLNGDNGQVVFIPKE